MTYKCRYILERASMFIAHSQQRHDLILQSLSVVEETSVVEEYN
jgi:hypothetical protein